MDEDEQPIDAERERMARILAQCGLFAADPDAVSRHERLTPWHIWPCNARIWRFWCSLQTQWVRAGMEGKAVGLNHCAVWAGIDGLKLRGRRWVFEVITQMERAALDVWREQAD